MQNPIPDITIIIFDIPHLFAPRANSGRELVKVEGCVVVSEGALGWVGTLGVGHPPHPRNEQESKRKSPRRWGIVGERPSTTIG